MTYLLFDNEVAETVAAELLGINAVKVQPDKPFTWSSGIISPIYCDNRLTLSSYDLRMNIGVNFAGMISVHASDTECIAGIATAGIPHGLSAANELGLPFLYVREKPKSHGRQNQIEGVLNAGDKVFVIEDLVSTGANSKRAIDAMKEESAVITGLGCIVTYGLPEADETFADADYPVISLTDYDTIIRVALAKEIIAPDQVELLKAWKKDPRAWRPA